MKELLEAIDIIGRHALRDPDFCGSTEGRRLTELLYQLTGTPRNREVAPVTTERLDLVSRTLVLPVELDVALTTIVSKTGIGSDRLIAEALSDFIAENRLG